MKHCDTSSTAAIVYREGSFRAVPDLALVTVALPTAGYTSLVTGTAAAAGAVTPADPVHYLPATSAVTLASGASAVDGAYNGMAIRITSGTGAGARGTVVGYIGSTKVAQVSWGTGVGGAAGVPAVLDGTSVYELSLDCYNRGKVVVKTEYSNATATAVVSVVLRDGNGLALDTAAQTPANMVTNDRGSSFAGAGYRARAFEVPTDGMDTAFLQVETAASGGSSPSVTCWGLAV